MIRKPYVILLFLLFVMSHVPAFAQATVSDLDGQWDGVVCFPDASTNKFTHPIFLELSVGGSVPDNSEEHRASLTELTDYSGKITDMASYGVALFTNGFLGVVLGAGEEAPGQRRSAILRVSDEAARTKLVGLFRFRNETSKQWLSPPLTITLFKKLNGFSQFVSAHQNSC